MKRYCVTAVNRLTGQREIITPPCSLENANAICYRMKETKAKKRSYTYPKAVEYPKQLNLFTKKLDL